MPVTSLLLPEELEWLTYYCRDRYLGDGAIVELGPWLGSSTIAMLQGLGQLAKIDTYDRFIWESWMNHFEQNSGFKPGDSFLDRFADNIQHDKRVNIHVQDLSQHTPYDKSIEFLVIDAAKSVEAFSSIARSLFPKLITGALIFDQDFRHAPTVHVYQKVFYYKLTHYLELVEVVGNAVVFKVIEVIPEQLVIDLIGQMWSSWDVKDTLDAIYRFLPILSKRSS